MTDLRILQQIEAHAAAHPERAVMIVPAADGTKKILTWGELVHGAKRLAAYLRRNSTSDAPVLVYGHKDPLMLISFLAAVYAGHAYCPVDVSLPAARIEAIIETLQPSVILATEPFPLAPPHLTDRDAIQSALAAEQADIDPACALGASDVFYLIFTSGSTGTPKGVQITGAALDSFIAWARTFLPDTGDAHAHTIMNQAPFSFDLSVMDLYLTLSTGGTLFALTADVQGDARAMYDAFRTSDLSVFVSTPSFADVCLSDPVFSGELLPSLARFLFCGEILTNRTVSRLLQRFPDAHIYNTYGPTESTCAVTGMEITKEINESVSPLPVGYAKEGTRILITGEDDLTPLPDGTHGEIVIAGDSVSKGYLGREDLNREKFGTVMIDGKDMRYYRTGDAGYLENGLLHYAGRIDLQVKLHGYRIEPGDIEAQLLSLDGVLQAVVVPNVRDGKVSSLNAVLVMRDPVTEARALSASVKEALRTRLPAYMIPKKILFRDDLPRTKNGKIDRRRIGETL